MEHKHDLKYLDKCLENSRSKKYLGETARRLNKRITEHPGKDNKLPMLKHLLQPGHPS